MIEQLLPALRMMLVMTGLTGLVYPTVMTGISQLVFRDRANGSLIVHQGRIAGSEWIGQRFTRPEYFHPRPSAAGNDGYEGMASGGSNLGPTSRKLMERIHADVDRFRKENPQYSGPIPADAVTASASGLDPEISPENADVQALRVAHARNVTPEQVRELVRRATRGRTLGFMGEPRVNVLLLNLALDRELAK